MKRIQAACLEQTIHFALKEDIGHAEAAALSSREAAAYQSALDRNHIRYQIEEKSTLPDGSVLLKIKRQYNSYNCGDYLQ